MPVKQTPRLLRAFLDMPNDSSTKTMLVALAVSLVCALVISTAAVLLRPRQIANQEKVRKEQILTMASRLPGLEKLMGTLEAPEVESRMIELATGKVVSGLDPIGYDPVEAANDSQQSIALPEEDDLAGIQRRSNFAPLHLVKQGDQVKLYVLSVYGSGYASTLFGYLALLEDANTIAALVFYEHGETPGIGGRIDSPEWRSQWQGKKVRDGEGRLRIDVAAGPLPASSPEAPFQVDGITGATRTTRGVADLLRFWLGDYGYGPYLSGIRSQLEGNP